MGSTPCSTASGRRDGRRPMRVREATPADVPAIRTLFNSLVRATTVAWRDEEASTDEMRDWFDDQHRAGHPVLVAELDDAIVGYTCWSTFRGGARLPGYRHTVEHTIHVDERHHGQGVGRALLTALIDEARRRHVHVVVAGIDADNLGSIAFHRALGFIEVARMPEVGRKFDRWLDLVIMQRIID
jgi:L-amino acid N-acyltransferase